MAIPIPVGGGDLPSVRPSEATMLRFSRAFQKLCQDLDVDAAFYVPVLTADRSAVRGALTGGEASATRLLDALVAAGASAIRGGAAVPPSTRPT